MEAAYRYTSCLLKDVNTQTNGALKPELAQSAAQSVDQPNDIEGDQNAHCIGRFSHPDVGSSDEVLVVLEEAGWPEHHIVEGEYIAHQFQH